MVDKAERQAVEHKEKPRLRARPEEEKQILRRLADGSEGPRRDPRVVKVKRFDIEPMFEEDAIAAMDELGHQFFVFVNAETERVAVLYRRHDDDYGLIEPVIGGDYTQGRSKAPSAPDRATAGEPDHSRTDQGVGSVGVVPVTSRESSGPGAGRRAGAAGASVRR